MAQVENGRQSCWNGLAQLRREMPDALIGAYGPDVTAGLLGQSHVAARRSNRVARAEMRAFQLCPSVGPGVAGGVASGAAAGAGSVATISIFGLRATLRFALGFS